jgi:2-polyprenyl-3-methyl-5-hydroxy-6-metoxy-1,4-benzoquinol methylase
MSILGEAILKNLVRLKARLQAPSEPPRGGAGDGGRLDEGWAAYIQHQFATSAALFAKYPNLSLAGKTVLDLGCGTGGRAAYLAEAGARRVVAIDVNAQEIEVARRICPALYPGAAGRVDYRVSSEHEHLDVGLFDVVMMVDSMEHVVSPAEMMRLAHGYTRPGGQFYFSNIGWYHYTGSHMNLLPFVNVFFSDETILDVMRWQVSCPDYCPTRFDSSPPSERWRGLYDLRDRPGERLNKLTIADMKLLVRHSIFASTEMTIVGFSSSHPAVRALNVLRHVPVVQEVIHSYVVVECRRALASEGTLAVRGARQAASASREGGALPLALD